MLGVVIALLLWCVLCPIALVAPIAILSDFFENPSLEDSMWQYIAVGAVAVWTALKYSTTFYGNAVRVSEKQFEPIYRMLQQMADRLERQRLPEVFVTRQEGGLNALAIRFLKLRFIVLDGETVDLLLRSGSQNELAFVLGHELAHYLLGHLSPARLLLLFPVRFIPFFGPAYSRACEMSADRLGAVLCGDIESAKRALIATACGSEVLAESLNLEAFLEQETMIPKFRAWLLELSATHPRTTLRVRELIDFENRLNSEIH